MALSSYLWFGVSGLRFGLPDAHHILSYNCDETNWIESLGKLTRENGYNPHPHLNQPAFFLQSYAAAAWIAVKTGYLTIPKSLAYLRDHPDAFARYFLVGRSLQIVYGIALLFVMWFGLSRLLGPGAASAAVLLMSVTPGLVAASHFIQSNLPVTTLSFAAIVFLMLDERNPKGPRRWLWLGSFFCGLALMTKFSAAPLFLVALYQAARYERPVQQAFASFFCFMLGVGLGDFFLFLSFGKAWETYHTISSQVIFNKHAAEAYYTPLEIFLYPLRYVLSFSLGPVQWLLFWISLGVLFARRVSGMRLVFLALGLFGIAITSVGMAASAGRILLVVPLAITIITCAGAYLWQNARYPIKTILAVSFCGLWASSVAYSMIIVKARRAEPNQKLSSAWILRNIDPSARIGIPRTPYYWSPDVVLGSYFWPERLEKHYGVHVLNYSIEEAKKMDYLIISSRDWHHAAVLGPHALALRTWLENSKEFQQVQAYPRLLKWGPITWRRPERYGVEDDDLWVYSMLIYRRVRADKRSDSA